MKSFRIKAVSLVLAAFGILLLGPTPAMAVAVGSSGVGATSLATPAAGSRSLYISVSGSDLIYPPTGSAYSDGTPYQPYKRSDCLLGLRLPSWVTTLGWSADKSCPEPSATQPLRSIQVGVLVAKAGDVIVVRAGVYKERVGYAAKQGTAAKPIVLQNFPGERVDLLGWLNLKDPDYWRISGLRFGYDATLTGTAQAVVALYGGTGWVFANNEVHDSTGVANLLVTSMPNPGNTTTSRTSAAPQSYSILGNCIRNQRGAHAAGTDHNLYLSPSIWSSGGRIEFNLMSGAPNGGNIKAAGSTDPNGAPTNVVIRHNTLLNAGSGVIVGQNAKNIEISWNVIGLPLSSDAYDGGVKTYAMTYPSTVGVKDNQISGYANAIRETGDLPNGHIFVARNKSWAVTYTGSTSTCSITLVDATVASLWGHKAG